MKAGSAGFTGETGNSGTELFFPDEIKGSIIFALITFKIFLWVVSGQTSLRNVKYICLSV